MQTWVQAELSDIEPVVSSLWPFMGVFSVSDSATWHQPIWRREAPLRGDTIAAKPPMKSVDAGMSKRNGGKGMDSRMRWMQVAWPTSTTMLELPISLAIMGIMALVATYGFQRALERLNVLEAVSIAPGPEITMTEYHAVNGSWPVSNQQAGYSAESLTKEGRLRSVEIREGGAVDVKFSKRVGILDNQTLSVRAWQGPTPDLPIVWRCGHSDVTPLAPTSEDKTTLGDEELPSPCRRHP
jgi:type II secretory pathway pseudopilin PulG